MLKSSDSNSLLTLNQTIDLVISNMNNIVKTYFNFNLNYIHFEPGNRIHEEIKTQLQISSPLSQDTDTFFSITIGNQILGAARLTQKNDSLNLPSVFHENFDPRKQALSFPNLHHNKQNDLMSFIEKYLQIALEILEDLFQIKSQEKKHFKFSLPLLVTGDNPLNIKRFINEVHDLSGRHTLAEIDCLDWNSCIDLLSAGPITIFIPEILALSLKQQQQIEHFLQLKAESDFPLLIGSSTTSLAQLKKWPSMSPSFLNRISTAYIQIPKDFTEIQCKQMTQYLFSSFGNVSMVPSLMN
ncbi:MAG: hypothetical protein K1X29_11700 [Bdellovibrionales bacterium]|nr:hypothetical protein [Bdellovibrionales bacterium]